MKRNGAGFYKCSADSLNFFIGLNLLPVTIDRVTFTRVCNFVFPAQPGFLEEHIFTRQVRCKKLKELTICDHLIYNCMIGHWNSCIAALRCLLGEKFATSGFCCEIGDSGSPGSTVCVVCLGDLKMDEQDNGNFFFHIAQEPHGGQVIISVVVNVMVPLGAIGPDYYCVQPFVFFSVFPNPTFWVNSFKPLLISTYNVCGDVLYSEWHIDTMWSVKHLENSYNFVCFTCSPFPVDDTLGPGPSDYSSHDPPDIKVPLGQLTAQQQQATPSGHLPQQQQHVGPSSVNPTQQAQLNTQVAINQLQKNPQYCHTWVLHFVRCNDWCVIRELWTKSLIEVGVWYVKESRS